MDIAAYKDGFAVSMVLKGFEYAWNKDKTLSVWCKDRELTAVTVTTYSGIFVEAFDESGAIVAEGGDGEWLFVRISKQPVCLKLKLHPDPGLSKKDIQKARKIVTRYLASDQPYSLNIPGTLVGVIEWLRKQLDEIPIMSRKKAQFKFDTTMEYGETYPKIEITYSEPETDEEVIKRIQIERERARIAENKDRAKLAELSAKFASAK